MTFSTQTLTQIHLTLTPALTLTLTLTLTPALASPTFLWIITLVFLLLGPYVSPFSRL